MGLLDQVLGNVLGSSQRGGQTSPIASILQALLSQQGGSGGLGGMLGSLTGGGGPAASRSSSETGLGGLLDRFNQAGHRDITDSWVGSGQNKPVAPRQVEEALGGSTIDDLSRQTGMSREEILSQLSNHLPNAVDQLTPQGQRPSPDDMKHW